MILFVYFSEMLLIYVSVNLSCGYVGMTQHFLDAAEIGASLQQMRTKAMAERMGADFARHARPERRFANDSPDLDST